MPTTKSAPPVDRAEAYPLKDFPGAGSLNSSQFEIPIWQRPYSWETTEWNYTLKDIIDSLGTESHVFGSCLIYPHDKSPPQYYSPSFWVVIDGQQRLTTLLLLSIILFQKHQDLRRSHDSNFVAKELRRVWVNENIYNNDQETSDDTGKSVYQRLSNDQITKFNNLWECFYEDDIKKVLQWVDTNIIDIGIRNAIKFYYHKFWACPHQCIINNSTCSYDDELKPSIEEFQHSETKKPCNCHSINPNYEHKLPCQGKSVCACSRNLVDLKLLEKIMNKTMDAVLIQIQLKDSVNANKVFSSLNTRGTSLSSVDLVKNDIMSQIFTTDNKITPPKTDTSQQAVYWNRYWYGYISQSAPDPIIKAPPGTLAVQKGINSQEFVEFFDTIYIYHIGCGKNKWKDPKEIFKNTKEYLSKQYDYLENKPFPNDKAGGPTDYWDMIHSDIFDMAHAYKIINNSATWPKLTKTPKKNLEIQNRLTNCSNIQYGGFWSIKSLQRVITLFVKLHHPNLNHKYDISSTPTIKTTAALKDDDFITILKNLETYYIRMFLKDRSQSESLGLLGWEILHPLMEQLHKILKSKTPSITKSEDYVKFVNTALKSKNMHEYSTGGHTLRKKDDKFYCPDDADVEKALYNFNHYDSNADITKYVLTRIDDEIARTTKATPATKDEIEVEHIIPNSILSSDSVACTNWRAYLHTTDPTNPGMPAQENLNKAVTARGSLSNLCLLSKPWNASLRQDSFNDKKFGKSSKTMGGGYEKETCRITRTIVASHSDWQIQDMRQYANELMPYIKTLWPAF